MTSEEIRSRLQSAGVKRISIREPMSRHTSWKVGGPADYFCVAEEAPQLLAALRVAREYGLPWLVLGGGYNVLVADEGVEGLVIANRLRGLRIEDAPSEPYLECGAGVFFAKAAQDTARQGFAGMEWGISIPGTVGGGVINNAGAHWSDVARALISATLLDDEGATAVLSSDDLAYRYRQSALKKPHSTRSHQVVVHCRFRLERDDPRSVLARLDELLEHRIRTQPVKEASAGSTFKNPPGASAGALIDRAGLKGHRLGGAQISPLHANFLLNTGGATADDILQLMRLAQERVQTMFGIRLEPEVQFIGRWPDALLRSVLHDAA